MAHADDDKLDSVSRSAGSDTAADDAEERELRADSRWQGRLRRYAWILALLVPAFVGGPFLTRYLDEYRAIVLEVKGEEMLVGYEHRPPEWVERLEVMPGQILDKARGKYSPVVVEPDSGDRTIVKLYERYNGEYTGTVVELLPPRPGQAATAIVQIDGGQRIMISTAAPGMEAAGPGARVSKRRGEWDPVLESLPPAQAPGAAPTPPPVTLAPPAVPPVPAAPPAPPAASQPAQPQSPPVPAPPRSPAQP